LRIFTFFAVFLSAICAVGQVNTSYYVAATGSDSNPGTKTAPWRTIQHAANTARAGSTVNVRDGVYEELLSVNVSGNASDGFITFRSYPGETAVLDAQHFTPTDRQGVVTIRNQSYVRVEGFEIRNFHTAEHRLSPMGIKGIAGTKTQIWAGIDIDIPTEENHSRSTPQGVKDAVTAALHAGVPGVVLSRKYSEMKLTNLSGAGDAVRELKS